MSVVEILLPGIVTESGSAFSVRPEYKISIEAGFALDPRQMSESPQDLKIAGDPAIPVSIRKGNRINRNPVGKRLNAKFQDPVLKTLTQIHIGVDQKGCQIILKRSDPAALN